MKYEISSAATAHELLPLHCTLWPGIVFPGASQAWGWKSSVRGKLGNISSPEQDIRHAEMVQHESEIEQQIRKSHKDTAAARAYPGKKGPTFHVDQWWWPWLLLAYKTSLGWSEWLLGGCYQLSKKFTALKMMGSLCQVWFKGTNQEDIEHDWSTLVKPLIGQLFLPASSPAPSWK